MNQIALGSHVERLSAIQNSCNDYNLVLGVCLQPLRTQNLCFTTDSIEFPMTSGSVIGHLAIT